MADITFDYNTSPSYSQLLYDRNSMFGHRNVFQQLLDKFQNVNIDVPISPSFLQMHGVSKEEIDTIEKINSMVQEGKNKLQELLQEYDKCNKNIDALTQKIKEVEDKVYQFDIYFRCLVDIDEQFSDIICSPEHLQQVKTSVIEDIELQLASSTIEKDKLEALILSLSKTYNILRRTPLVHICPICMTNDVDTFLEPCGHTICKECISNKFCNSNKFCYMCRTPIRNTKKIYFSS